MPLPAREKTGRNDRCPCGSGKKFKQCCLNAAPASQNTPWKRQRDASDRLTGDLLDFANRKFKQSLQEAWADFNQLPFSPPYQQNTSERQIFMPYFLFEWDPERPVRHRRGQSRAGVVVESYLDKSANSLSELEASILQQATTQPVSFFEVLHAVPGESLAFRDILIGGEVEVIERSASTLLRPGDIAYAQIWRLPEVDVLGRLAPIPLPPRNKVELVQLRAKLRKKIAKQNRELDALDLLRYTDDIRTVYLHIRDALLRPPVFCNTDGDPILFHTLKFRIGSAQAAFDALAPLAYGDSREDLLDYAEVSPDGTLLSAEIEWRKQGNQKFKSWDNTILGRCSIDGRTLVAEVNSKRRAETLRHEIEQRLGLLAVHQSTVTQTAQELAKTQDLQKATASSHAETSAMAFDPEARELAKAEMQKMAEGWVHQKSQPWAGAHRWRRSRTRTDEKSWKLCCWNGSAATKVLQARQSSASTPTTSAGSSA